MAIKVKEHSHPSFSVAGIHLAGGNAPRTAIVVLSYDGVNQQLSIKELYEKIGSYGSVYSDDRILKILANQSELQEVFVDTPLSVPPCVGCQRKSCPGVISCEDISVAYMLAITKKLRLSGLKKLRPVNPQSHRLWDIYHLSQNPQALRGEPSYSANMAPLVTRGLTLQRRVHHQFPLLNLKETNVALSLMMMGDYLGLDQSYIAEFSKFGKGSTVRKSIVAALHRKQKFLTDEQTSKWFLDITQDIYLFDAFITAYVAFMQAMGKNTKKPEIFLQSEGWVFLPEPAHSPPRGNLPS